MYVPRSIVALAILVALSLFVGARTQANPMTLDTGWAGPHPSQIRSFSVSVANAASVVLVPPLPSSSPFKAFVVTDVHVAGPTIHLSDGTLIVRANATPSIQSLHSGWIFDGRSGVTVVTPGGAEVSVSGYYY